jgi:regulator of protease activity HflC (stomatin/prohibitin superfamily)
MEKDIPIRRMVVLGIRAATAIVVLVVGLNIFFGSWYTVSPGHRGVIVRLGAVQKGVSGEGFHWKLPWLDTIENMDVRVQKDPVKADAASHDLQIVTTQVVANYYVIPEKADEVFQKLGFGYADTVISPALQEIVKAVTAKYSAEELITKRALVKSQIKELLVERLLTYNVTLVDISIADFNFAKSFNDAIEAKQVAEQQVATSRNTLEQIKVEALSAIATAHGQAESRLEIARAEAEANRLKLLSLTPQLIQYEAIRKWDGELPTFVGGTGIPFIGDVSKLKKEKKSDD